MIEKLREELINDIISELDKSVPAHLSDENNEVHNTITQIIVDTFNDYELKVTGSNRFNKVENSMTQEAKFELLNYKLRGTLTEYLVKLYDADGHIELYHVTDYYNKNISEITGTKIWRLQAQVDIVNENLIENDSRLGKKILTFISLLKALQITSKVLKEKINYDINVTLDKKYVLYSGDIVDMGIRKLS